jgi:DNA-binding FadR family transcriptional regulator
MQTEWFEEFARQILKEKGVNPPDEAVEKQLVQDIAELTRDVVLREMINSLSEQELKDLHEAVDRQDEAAAQKVMESHQAVIAVAMQQVRKQYLGAQ